MTALQHSRSTQPRATRATYARSPNSGSGRSPAQARFGNAGTAEILRKRGLAARNGTAAAEISKAPADPKIMRFGDVSKVPPGLACPVATRSPPTSTMEVQFRESSATLTRAQRAALQALCTSWHAAGSKGDVELHGFASVDGPDALNWTLSCDRAQAVRAELTSPLDGRIAGIPASALPTFAHGETDEFSPSHAPNRRVVVSHLAPAPPPAPKPTPKPPPARVCSTPTNPDFSGRGFNPTTDGETFVTAANLSDVPSVLGCRSTAFDAATRSAFLGAHLGPEDALRHCVWNCCMSQKIGSGQAEKFATAHENSSPSSIPFDNQMDLHDNVVGRSLGTPGANCEGECTTAVTSGKLRTIRQPPLVSAPCIGPSDQPWP